ncbi:tRNA A64-2'-O-ribosylphosphate transferase [Cokeromyces recurvatus]|uniref:tRNA A64-2'-O-ribosylphosphate transferase n=1 Tax=Cokeromyces recurvatus TaxID=90255 RepID=UPI00221FD815|nr:tRNA A64-2'-O-ribosylphosphate transferase [Cokeromyces recurvatus]KAI7904851.1 tRNA A64-2'-O-ribosylphosphate transferase [Cokeromyces recurvatus]
MDEDLFSERNEFNFESKLIRNDDKNIYNRLRSIVDDASFVMEITDLLPNLALIANERCGSWYIDCTKKKAYSAYFKSTDGHMHIWDFNIRRNNLHLIPILMKHNGGIIVDSTRKGKRIPDALSKTIPIWCCTVNRAVARYRGYSNNNECWDVEFHSLPSTVSRSEHAQIEAKIDGFVEKLLDSGVDMETVSKELKKPLRPIWYTPKSYDTLISSPPDFDADDIDFCPVICLSASEAVEAGYQLRAGYLYVQGSGDDQEAWAMGLTPNMLWKHRDEILTSSGECEGNVKNIVLLYKSKKLEEETNEKNYAFIKPTTLAIGNSAKCNKPPHCWEVFDYVINCSNSEEEVPIENDHYLYLPIPEGKKGQIIFGSSIQKAIDFVRDPILKNKKILVQCSTGKDHSVGILLAILIYYFDLDGQLLKDKSARVVDKKLVQHQLVKIISHWEKASPSRVTLKRLNTFFMSHLKLS